MINYLIPSNIRNIQIKGLIHILNTLNTYDIKYNII